MSNMSRGHKIVHADGIQLCVETFGRQTDPAILFVGGSTADMEWVDKEFCQRLSDAGRYVIRYDQRDTGNSVSYPLGSPPYGFDELVADAAALLDALEISRAHIVGMSLGGGIAQRLALEHSEIVETITLISTSPGLRPSAPPYPDLPPMSAQLQAQFSQPDSMPQHNHWLISSGADYRSLLRHIAAPTLVIHGDADPLFPPGHGEALAREIPGAELLVLPGVGHEMAPRQMWDVVIPALLRHTSKG